MLNLNMELVSEIKFEMSEFESGVEATTFIMKDGYSLNVFPGDLCLFVRIFFEGKEVLSNENSKDVKKVNNYLKKISK